MDVNVFTYYHPQKWQEHKEFDAIKKEIHICATKNMAEGIKDCYRKDDKGEFQYIFTIRQVINRLFAWWNTPEFQLKQYLALSREIGQMSSGNPLLKEFRNNTTELLDTIRFLVFTGLTPEDLNIKSLTDKESFFSRYLASLENNDTSYQKLREQLKRDWQREEVIKRLNRSLKKKSENLEIPLTHTKIVLHGFYFITPEQQVFLEAITTSWFSNHVF